MPLTPPQAIHQQIAAELRRKIATGDHPVGSTLPSEPQLAEVYGVSRNTINRAVVELRREGLVEVRRGIGTVVVADQPAAVTVRLTPEMRRAAGDDAEGWVLDACEQKLRRQQP